MVAPRQVEVPVAEVLCQYCEPGFGALSQVIGKTVIPFLREFFVAAAKRIGADLLEFAAPKIAEVVVGSKSFQSAAMSVGRQIPRKHMGSGSQKRQPMESFQLIRRTNQSVSKRFFTSIFHESCHKIFGKLL